MTPYNSKQKQRRSTVHLTKANPLKTEYRIGTAYTPLGMAYVEINDTDGTTFIRAVKNGYRHTRYWETVFTERGILRKVREFLQELNEAKE